LIQQRYGQMGTDAANEVVKSMLAKLFNKPLPKLIKKGMNKRYLQ